MKIEWNKVTWYSKLLAAIVFAFVVYLSFYFRGEYKEIKSTQFVLNKDFDISEWKTYRNENYGYEFKYPADWVIVEGVHRDGSISFSVEVFDMKTMPADSDGIKDLVKVYFDGPSCKNSDWKINSFFSYREFCLLENPNIMIFAGASSEERKNIDEKIVSTFKFTN